MDHQTPPSAARFGSTHWSLISAAVGGQPEAAEALDTLCRAYWYPLYSYLRRRGYSPEDSRDLTQDFFADLLNRDALATADPHRGRFRNFLLGSLRNFTANWERYRHALRRGGGRFHESLDAAASERRYQCEPAVAETPEAAFERQWALTLLERVRQQLAEDYARRNRGQVFEALSCYLGGEQRLPSHAEVAHQLGWTSAAVKVAVHRLRRRFGDLLREEVARTVDTPAEVEEELQALFRAVSS